MGNLAKYKPGASVKTHLFTAALLWSFVGVYLMVLGVVMQGDVATVLLVFAFVLGTIKSYWLLDRAARKNIGRILDFKDGTCLGGVYSPKMWGMILLMVFLGRFLRTSSLPGKFVGVLYIAIGWGLLLSSRLIWKQWRK